MAKTKVAAIKPKKKVKGSEKSSEKSSEKTMNIKLVDKQGNELDLSQSGHFTDVGIVFDTPIEMKGGDTLTVDAPSLVVDDLPKAPEVKPKVYCQGCKYCDSSVFMLRCVHPNNITVIDYPSHREQFFPSLWTANEHNDCILREDSCESTLTSQPAPPLTFWDRVKGWMR